MSEPALRGTPLPLEPVPATAKIDVREVTKVYATRHGPFRALERVPLRVAEKEFISLLGPSGCGKSTLLGLMAGLDRPTEGEVWVGGRPVEGPGADRGVVFQSYTLFPWLTVAENIAFGPRLKGLPEKVVRETADRYLDLIGLRSFARAYPSQLSGGMKQRVAIARALANAPDVLLMDEPFGALDAQTRLAMQELLVRVWERERVTVVFVTHDIEEALFLSNRVVVMRARPGRVQAEFEVPLPYPRQPEMKDAEAFRRLKNAILALLREGWDMHQ